MEKKMSNTETTDPHTVERVRTLNDDLRRKHTGGRVVITDGIQSLGHDETIRILAAIARFDTFTAENDPYGEHDCASLEVDGHKIIWKIDYYDHSMQFSSLDPSDPMRTRRIMTVMLAEEY
jgi:hypothetical protein